MHESDTRRPSAAGASDHSLDRGCRWFEPTTLRARFYTGPERRCRSLRSTRRPDPSSYPRLRSRLTPQRGASYRAGAGLKLMGLPAAQPSADFEPAPPIRPSPRYVVAVIGNPNTGKTTLFNALTGLSQHTGNYPGVTVESAVGEFTVDGTHFLAVDLPGTYSLAPRAPDEMIAVKVLLGFGEGVH